MIFTHLQLGNIESFAFCTAQPLKETDASTYFPPITSSVMDLESCAVSGKAVWLFFPSLQLIQKLPSQFTVAVLGRPRSEGKFGPAETTMFGFRLPADI